jgi:CubicO group peptidase (beta-lactamase class C family)
VAKFGEAILSGSNKCELFDHRTVEVLQEISIMRLLSLALALLAAVRIGAATLSPSEVDALVAEVMKELQVPGAAVGLIQDGTVVLAKGYGVRDLSGTASVTPKTLFAVGSITKSFTAASCATVVDEGKLAWDTPVREYWSWFRLHDPTATELITLRDLLTHRSGLPRHDFIRMSTPIHRDELLRRLRYLEPSHTFRETFQYNNLMYVAAGFLCADQATMSWEDLVRKRIFEPLAMTGSTVAVKDSQRASDFARPHELFEGKSQPTDFYDYQRFGIGPNGAVNSSVEDMLKYLQFYLDRGKADGRQVVTERQFNELLRPVTVAGDGNYALGWFIDHYRGHRRIAHGGGITGFTANAVLFPESKIGIIVLNNLASPLPQIVTNSIADRVLGLEPQDHLKRFVAERERLRREEKPASEEKAGPKPSFELAAYAGKYSHPAFGAIEVRQEGEELSLVFPAWTSRLKHRNFDTFVITRLGDAFAQFQLNSEGKVARLLLPLERAVKPFVFERQ